MQHGAFLGSYEKCTYTSRNKRFVFEENNSAAEGKEERECSGSEV